MEERKINLEEILNAFSKQYGEIKLNPRALVKASEAILAMKEACRQILELAAENAKAYAIGMNPEEILPFVDKQSILDTIKEVE